MRERGDLYVCSVRLIKVKFAKNGLLNLGIRKIETEPSFTLLLAFEYEVDC